jgi:hypothetical protein
MASKSDVTFCATLAEDTAGRRTTG